MMSIFESARGLKQTFDESLAYQKGGLPNCRDEPCGLTSLGGIHPFPEFLSRFEVDGIPRGQLNWLTGFGVATDPWFVMVQRKPAEPTNFDFSF
jgi:hypothetical protein